jgi:hypothetical protein
MAEPKLKINLCRKDYKKKQFLEAFAKLKTIWAAAKSVNIDRQRVYNWRKTDPEFEAAYQVADCEATERLETVAHARAESGKSDQLLIFLLKARDPEKYKERIQHDLDPKVMDILVAQFTAVIKKNVADMCPHCNTNLGLTTKIAKDLEELSLTMGAR